MFVYEIGSLYVLELTYVGQAGLELISLSLSPNYWEFYMSHHAWLVQFQSESWELVQSPAATSGTLL